ncbi:MAG TPA: hypothetical protein VHL11_25015, partial [Phototrophicaceae bacterium]|nr:hypothetical protein [Phototrophicaceae bacterium]
MNKYTKLPEHILREFIGRHDGNSILLTLIDGATFFAPIETIMVFGQNGLEYDDCFSRKGYLHIHHTDDPYSYNIYTPLEKMAGVH